MGKMPVAISNNAGKLGNLTYLLQQGGDWEGYWIGPKLIGCLQTGLKELLLPFQIGTIYWFKRFGIG